MFPIDFFWRAAQRWPARVAIDAPEGSICYDALADRVAALAAGLTALDPTPQSRVGICAGNSAEHIAALLAVLACGKVWVPLNPKSTRSEIRRIVDVTEPSILVFDAACAELLEGAPGVRVCIGAAQGARPAGSTLADLVRDGAGAPRPVIDLPPDATQAIKFTGGTTGVPKGVMQPYRAWMANIVNQIHAWGFDEHERYVVAAPITHGTSTYILPVLAQGGCHVLPDGAGAQAVRAAFRERGGSACFMPPTLIYMLMALPGAARSDYPRLRRLIYGAAPMPPEKIHAVRAFFGPVLGTTYGQTEAPQVLSVMRPEDFEDPHNVSAVGRVTWFNDLAIMAPDGRLLPAGEVGEVVARGDLLMTGYWRLPEKTAETLAGGWLHTGDRGLIDARGYLHLRDRLKDMVISGGFNVYPVDVENALGQHPAVYECAVFGLPDEKWGETVQAAVQLHPGQVADEAALIAFVRERLGPVQTPKRIHFHDSLPRSPVGKVLKSAVRDAALAALKSVPDAS
ncbi:class I adenylate-forming enzyme family protein [Verminephrobacter aporrectodeae]|uniref:class I adenylate-forming enzyme family protein n=1 Tax=Verminephrobacter aporrectodeae TaxID=1110389 RepID=UPI00223857B2|nr:AMP-binding protein [Verminephrobacter aporrectodeae]MCW5221382.1 long-chain fatty acid--CoA ligase [Verminephrobacter aporrectodeae subsp. tuberculatae]MCW5290673.1 long-chain fatty acid--CoA ligase [Verminephrobacter aporrectodeae subsp. tuberculatae]MCW8166602.1 long-chain fatty acid--CoA ligase [Verminephrobacter aporrectodeae subsp. tuberculatae]MCW8170779.1 long-chain fatty acid--CoA ligase [Verminephrobacter aporrectodeae subsp. tuberculatae]MCW8177314.1 long-chain fatty acid--CoA li